MTITLTLPQRDALVDLQRELALFTRSGPPIRPTWHEAKTYGQFRDDDDILDFLNGWDQPAAERRYQRNVDALEALATILGKTKVGTP